LPEQTLIAAGWPSLPDAVTAELLIDRYARTSRNPDRRGVRSVESSRLTNAAADGLGSEGDADRRTSGRRSRREKMEQPRRARHQGA
jgi:hypothetical protein